MIPMLFRAPDPGFVSFRLEHRQALLGVIQRLRVIALPEVNFSDVPQIASDSELDFQRLANLQAFLEMLQRRREVALLKLNFANGDQRAGNSDVVTSGLVANLLRYALLQTIDGD